MQKLFWLWCAGGFGTLLRYGMAHALYPWVGNGFPYGTFAVNIIGCFAIGVIVQAIPDSPLRMILAVGILGGFTTFSGFGLETFNMVRSGAIGLAILYTGLSVILGAATVWAGMALGKVIVPG